jgi:hypothetical protein
MRIRLLRIERGHVVRVDQLDDHPEPVGLWI